MQVRLQYYPDGYEWAEDAPVLISEGYSGHAAGVSGRQALPTKFNVSRNQSVQGIFLNRQIVSEWADEKVPEPSSVGLCKGQVITYFDCVRGCGAALGSLPSARMPPLALLCQASGSFASSRTWSHETRGPVQQVRRGCQTQAPSVWVI